MRTNIEGRHPLRMSELYPNGRKIPTTHTQIDSKLPLQNEKRDEVRSDASSKEGTGKSKGNSRPRLESSMRDTAESYLELDDDRGEFAWGSRWSWIFDFGDDSRTGNLSDDVRRQ